MATVKRDAAGTIIEYDADPRPSIPSEKEAPAAAAAIETEENFTSVIAIHDEADRRLHAVKAERERVRKSAMEEAAAGLSEPTKKRDAAVTAALKVHRDTMAQLDQQEARALAAAKSKIQSEFDIKRNASKKVYEDAREAANKELRAIMDSKTDVYEKIRARMDEELREAKETIDTWRRDTESRYQGRVAAERAEEEAAQAKAAGESPIPAPAPAPALAAPSAKRSRPRRLPAP
jgi:hypothetical protein